MGRYKKLKIDFEIPEIIERDIEEMLICANSNGTCLDCHIDNLKADLNGCDLCLTEDQIKLLKDYYCRGGGGFYG